MKYSLIFDDVVLQENAGDVTGEVVKGRLCTPGCAPVPFVFKRLGDLAILDVPEGLPVPEEKG